jgi:hypothetical protein
MILTSLCEHVGKEQQEWGSRCPEDVSPIRGVVPGTEETDDGESTSVSEGRQGKEISNAE